MRNHRGGPAGAALRGRCSLRRISHTTTITGSRRRPRICHCARRPCPSRLGLTMRPSRQGTQHLGLALRPLRRHSPCTPRPLRRRFPIVVCLKISRVQLQPMSSRAVGRLTHPGAIAMRRPTRPHIKFVPPRRTAERLTTRTGSRRHDRSWRPSAQKSSPT